MKRIGKLSLAVVAVALGSGGSQRRHVGQEDRAVEQLCRQFLAPGDAAQLGQGDQGGGQRRHRGRSRSLHHGREPGDRAGGPDPESGAAGLRCHRAQRRLAGRPTGRSRRPATRASPWSRSTASSPSPAPGGSRSTSSRWARMRCSTSPRRCRAATCSRSAGSPACSSTTRSARASTRASARTRSSRSWARCTATGTRPRHRPP